jgi:hypothetical protein
MGDYHHRMTPNIHTLHISILPINKQLEPCFVITIAQNKFYFGPETLKEGRGKIGRKGRKTGSVATDVYC